MWGPAPPVSALDVVFEGRLEAAATFAMVPQAAAELLRPAGAEQSQERCRNLEPGVPDAGRLPESPWSNWAQVTDRSLDLWSCVKKEADSAPKPSTTTTPHRKTPSQD